MRSGTSQEVVGGSDGILEEVREVDEEVGGGRRIVSRCDTVKWEELMGERGA